MIIVSVFFSADLNASLEVKNLNEALIGNPKFKLIQSLLRVINPSFGFELHLYSDFPMKSGLGGSAVIASAILGAFNQMRQDKWTSHEIAELAFQAERLYMGIAGGWQDQYASVFGGFNFMEFKQRQNIVHPLRINNEVLVELEESFLLCNMGTTHDSGDIHNDQKYEMQKKDVQQMVKMNVDLTYKMRDQILKGQLGEFGKSLHQGWEYKKHFSKKISNKHINSIYSGALKNGASGGKVLGAGGGGFFLFFVNPFKKYKLKQFLVKEGLKIQPFNFDLHGLKQWTVRNDD